MTAAVGALVDTPMLDRTWTNLDMSRSGTSSMRPVGTNSARHLAWALNRLSAFSTLFLSARSHLLRHAQLPPQRHWPQKMQQSGAKS